MADLRDIISFTNDLLRISEIPDYSAAHNGLQLTSAAGSVSKIAAAVDACESSIKLAVDAGADLMIVHHGMFWNGVSAIDGAMFRKLKLAMDHNLAIYSAHVPLDVHPELGNNALFANALELKEQEPFFPWKSIELGIRGRANVDRAEFIKRVESAVGSSVHMCPGGPEEIRNVGVITGGAGGEVLALKDAGVDTFITGEGPHWSYTAAEEMGLNVIYAGHYATEVFGVQALAGLLSERFECEYQFLDHPTGL